MSRLIVFDFDGTLTDAEEATREAWFEALRPDDPAEICVRRGGFVPGVVYATEPSDSHEIVEPALRPTPRGQRSPS